MKLHNTASQRQTRNVRLFYARSEEVTGPSIDWAKGGQLKRVRGIDHQSPFSLEEEGEKKGGGQGTREKKRERTALYLLMQERFVFGVFFWEEGHWRRNEWLRVWSFWRVCYYYKQAVVPTVCSSHCLGQRCVWLPLANRSGTARNLVQTCVPCRSA